MVDQEEQPYGHETDDQEERTDSEESSSTHVEVEAGDIEGSTVATAGHDVVYSGNVFVDVTVGTASGEPVRLAKEIAKNVVSAVRGVSKERDQEKRLEEQAAEVPALGAPTDLPEVEHWFREDLSAVREKYFVITLSLFNGLKWADLWDIYQAILESRGLLGDEDDQQGSYLFEQTDQELVDNARARIVRRDDQAAEVVEFRNEDYAAAVLELLRNHYRPRLVELLPGLGRLGEHPYWEIRARAAYAVAEIAKLDFHRARRQVLESWAQDDRSYVRAAVGYTASRLIEDGIADVDAQKMLSEWGDPQEHRGWEFRWAAAASYKQVGLEDPILALNGLKEVARNDDIRIADAVIYALLVISFDDKLETVLDRLGEWLDEDERSKDESGVVPLVATLAFLTLGNAFTSQAGREPDDGEGQEDDEFLTLLATDDGTCRSVVLSALSKALKYRLTDEAFDVLKGWTRQVGDSNGRLAALRDLIADWYMRLWQDGHQIGMASTLGRLKRWTRDRNTAVKRVAQVAVGEIKRRVDAAPLPP
jgi:hypothetical protein